MKNPIKSRTKINKFIDNNIFVVLAFVCSAVLMLLVYYCFDVIPFGDKTVLRMDLFHQYGPLFAEFYDRLTSLKSFIYSWNTGGGGAFLGNYYNYLSSPVGDIIALIFGHDNIPEAIGAMVLVKNALASSMLALYLRKSMKRNDFTISAFGIMYSFCGFFIAYYWNIMWIDAMYILPLAVLGIEKIVNERKCKLYTISLALAFFSNYYMAYMLCIFAVLYFLVYFISNCTFNDSYKSINKENTGLSYYINTIYYNKFFHSGVLFTVSSILGVALVAFAVIPTYLCLKSCSATSGTFPDSSEYYNNIFDFIANHLASVEPTIRSSGDTVLPNVYCGMLTVLLIPLYAFCNKINFKERIAHIVLLALFFVGFNLNYANYILHALHFPNDLPYRFSYLYCFFLVTMAYKVLMHIKDISAKAIIGSGLGIMLFIALVQKTGMANVSDTTVYVSIGFTAVYVVVLGLMRKKEYAQSTIALLLMCCVFAEAAISNTDHFKITQEKPNFVNGYSDFTTLKSKLDKLSDEKMYRMELSYINTLMDASWFNYNGISVFSSMAYESSSNLQDNLGVDSNYINSYVYHPQTPVYNAMMSLKYLVKNDDYTVNEDLFSYVTSCGNFEAYENKYYLPLAYAVSNDVMDWDNALENPFEVQNDYWLKASGVGDVFEQIDATSYDTDNLEDEYIDLENNSIGMYKTIDGEACELVLNYEITESQNVYLYFEGSGVDSISVFTDGETDLSQDVDEAYILDCGYCEAGQTLTVKIPVAEDEETGMIECYVAGLDMEAFEAGYEVLRQGGMSINEYEETYIKGTVTVGDNQMLYTSINYDEGWTVKVDGQTVKVEKIGDALIGVKLTAGTHTVEFEYHAKGLSIGIAISGASLVILLLVTIFNALRKKRKSPKSNEILIQEDENTLRGIDALMAEDMRDENINQIDEIIITQETNIDEIINENSED